MRRAVPVLLATDVATAPSSSLCRAVPAAAPSSPMSHAAPVFPSSDAATMRLLPPCVALRPCSPKQRRRSSSSILHRTVRSGQRCWSSSPLHSVTSGFPRNNATDRPEPSLHHTIFKESTQPLDISGTGRLMAAAAAVAAACHSTTTQD
ncbi:hypothetical protein HN51_038728 [Arachis hypogaea]